MRRGRRGDNENTRWEDGRLKGQMWTTPLVTLLKRQFAVSQDSALYVGG